MKKEMTLSLGIPFDFGFGISGTVYGGPYREYVPGTRRLVGLKMAQEIKHPNDCAVDTEDFSIPDLRDAQRGVIFILQSFAAGKDVYAGCMGGIGRTGLILGCMATTLNDWNADIGASELGDPVAYVRKHFKPHAIETHEQQGFVRNFDSAPVIQELLRMTEPEVKTVEIVKEVYLGPVAWAMHLLFGTK